MKKTFIIHNDSLDVLDILTDEQCGKLLKKMRAYNTESDYDSGDKIVDVAFLSFKNQFDRDNTKYNNICEKNIENGKKGGRPKNPENPNGYLGNPKKPGKADNDSDSKNDSKSKSILKEVLHTSPSNDVSTELSTDKKRTDIDTLLDVLKETADAKGIIYDTEKERMFAKHILDAHSFGEFAKKIGQDRTETAKRVMIQSVDMNYWKGGACAGPMTIYKNYSEIYNSYRATTKKQEGKERVGFIPGL